MPEQFMNDKGVALKWKLYGYMNGFWLNGRTMYATNEHFAEKFGVSERSIVRALVELEEMGLCTRNVSGMKRTILPGGIVKGGRPASGGGDSQRHARGDSQRHHNSISNSINITGETGVSQEYEVVIGSTDLDEKEKPRGKAKYPNAPIVFGWFSRPQKSWKLNTTELKHAELLFERGEKKVKAALEFIAENKDEDYFPKVTKPSDLERKWNDLLEFKKKNNL